MKKTAYGKPILINTSDQSEIKLKKMDAINESFIQHLVFNNPDILPVSDIDESFNPLIPICMELTTGAGPIDIFMMTPSGDLVIIETKLWRNPESRRKVIAQILDYSKELTNWKYEDLQREVNKRLSRKGNTPFKIAMENYEDLTLQESDFVDSVSRNLKNGKFMLLVVGDGIKEGAFAISEFISMYGNLRFNLAMIELNLYEAKEVGTLIVPKTIVKTVEIPKFVVELPDNMKIVLDENIMEFEKSNFETDPEKQKAKSFYNEFWDELINELEFDDPGQSIPNPRKDQNYMIYPSENKNSWISAYFMQSKNQIGVYFKTKNNSEGNEIFEQIKKYRKEIESDLGPELSASWKSNDYISVSTNIQNIFDSKNRSEIKEFFKFWLNKYVNIFRPILKKME